MPTLAPSELLARLGLPSTIHLGGFAGTISSIARVPLHLHELDAALDGGLPRGQLSEIVGPSSCGKTALLYALLATGTARGEVVALVDLADAFSPSAAAAAGIDLARTLWIRPASVRDALRCAELLLEASGFGAVAVDLGTAARGARVGTGAGLRLARAAKRSEAAVVLLADERVAGTFAALGLALRPLRQHWSRHGCGPNLFDGFEAEAVLVRNKFGAPRRATTVRVAAR